MLNVKGTLKLAYKGHPHDSKVKSCDCPFEILYEVCVLDLDKPWEEFKVCHSTNPITHLNWDLSGTRLLVVDGDGMFEVWQMQNFLISQWSLMDRVGLRGEEVLALSWLHNGIQISFNPDKKDCVLYGDKFQRAKFSPTVTHFGGKPMDGWIAVTATGMVCVGLIQNQEQKVIIIQENLAPSHLRLAEADVAFTSTGEIMVATSDGLMSSAIQCFLVKVKIQQASYVITCQAGASLYMKNQIEYGSKDSQMLRITHLNFMNRENSDTLIIGCGCHGYSCIEVWQLIEQTLSLHRMFQNTSNPDFAYKTPKWMHKATIPHHSMLTSIALPRIPMSHNIVDTAGFVSYFTAAYKDGSMNVIHRQSYQVLLTSTLESLIGIHVPGPNDDKWSKSFSHLSALIQTPSGCGLIGLRGDSAYLFQVFNARDGPIQMISVMVVHLLEYVIYVGYDWWDVLMTVGQGMIERICQRLADNFQKQPISMQELLRVRLVRLKIGLYSCVSAGQQKASDCRALLSLYAISSVLKSILRPKLVTAQDKTPSEKLSAVCSKHADLELDALLVNLETDEFIVEAVKKEKSGQSEMSLQSLQPFIQWVADFSLHLLTSMPLYQSYSSFLGLSLLRNCSVLNTLRELIVIIRLWGLINPFCLPVFTTTSYFDSLSHIYKLLTKAWLCCREGNNTEYDDTLMDECCLLPSKVLIPNMKQSFGEENYSFSLFGQAFPLSFCLGEEPDYLYNLKQTRHVFMPEVTTETNQHHDAVRHIHLGVKPSEAVRECCRCCAMSLLHSTTKSPMLISWEQRFVKTCLCGGHWKLKSS